MNTTKVEDPVNEKRVITEVHCYACGHNWLPRTAKMPVVCPRCKRFKWQEKDWEASKAQKRKHRGGKHVSIKKAAHLGPETERFLQSQRRKET